MIDSLNLYRKADRLACRFGTSDPEAIAKSLGIALFDNLNTNLLLGMYLYKWRNRMIFLNRGLEDHVRKCVIAHELGHDQLHRGEVRDGAIPCFLSFFSIAIRVL